MKLKHKILWIASVFIVVLLATFLLRGEKVDEIVHKYFGIEEGKKESIQNFTQGKVSPPNETNYSAQPPTGGGSPGEKGEGGETAKAIALEITDICSGKLNLLTVSEGATKCLNRKYPYQIILEKNSTHLATRFYDLKEFEEIYELDETIPIFFIFVEDVASVSYEIQSFSLEGSENFDLGQYYLHTIWEKDTSGNLVISKMIAILPLEVSSNITSSDWKELKFYLNIPNKTYYLGNLWVLVKEK